jgi:hypothetical protein
VAQPLVDQDERRPVPGVWSEADNPLQREDTNAEMHDSVTGRLARGVRTRLFPDVPLFFRQLWGNARGEFRTQLVDGELAPGQHTFDLCASQLDRLAAPHIEFFSVCSAAIRKCRSESSVGGSTPVVNTGAPAVGK